MTTSLEFEGVPWLLTSGVDVAGSEAVAPSALFEAGQVSGSTGCNRYIADYTVDGTALTLGEIASTKIACAPPADEVERVYLAALQRVRAWQWENGELALLDADQVQLLRYRAGTMEQEAAYLAALPTALRFGVEGDSLNLLSAEGTFVVSYTRGAGA